MHLWRGLFPLLIDEPKPLGLVAGDAWIQDVENRVQNALDGDNIILVTGWRGGSGNTNTLRIIQYQ